MKGLGACIEVTSTAMLSAMERSATPGATEVREVETLDNPGQYLTVSAAAAQASVAEETIRAWYDMGEITGTRTPHGHRLIDPDSLKQRVQLQEKYMSVGQAAREFDRSPYHVRGWFDAGLVTGFRTPSGRRRIDRNSITAYVATLNSGMP